MFFLVSHFRPCETNQLKIRCRSIYFCVCEGCNYSTILNVIWRITPYKKDPTGFTLYFCPEGKGRRKEEETSVSICPPRPYKHI
jgi:hypothetical protein